MDININTISTLFKIAVYFYYCIVNIIFFTDAVSMSPNPSVRQDPNHGSPTLERNPHLIVAVTFVITMNTVSISLLD